MDDYTELVKALRDPCPHENCVLSQQAADVIEELSKENAQFCKMAKVYIDGMNDIATKCADIVGIEAEPPKEDTE